MANLEQTLAFDYLLSAKDFDGTIARTFEPAPNGMTVELAYEKAVEQVLGEKALAIYRSQGLRNRAPGELVSNLASHLAPSTQLQRTEDLVEAKLGLLCDQIGKRFPDHHRWPRLTDGYAGMCRFEAEQPLITTAIVSSGHQNFINRFFEVHELPGPDLMVTDDDMRPAAQYLPPDICVKPSRLLLDVVHYKWLEKLGMTNTYEELVFTRGYMVYSGDDPHKDGELAANADVPFIHIDPQNPASGWQRLRGFLTGEEALLNGSFSQQ